MTVKGKNRLVGTISIVVVAILSILLAVLSVYNMYADGATYFVLSFCVGGVLNLVWYLMTFASLNKLDSSEAGLKKRKPKAIVGSVFVTLIILATSLSIYLIFGMSYIGFAAVALAIGSLLNGAVHFFASYRCHPYV